MLAAGYHTITKWSMMTIRGISATGLTNSGQESPARRVHALWRAPAQEGQMIS